MNPQRIKREKTPKEKMRTQWDNKRKKLRPIILRDANYICANPYCRKRDESGTVLDIDHKTPISSGGTNEIENLQVLCKPCNLKKGTKTMRDWQDEIYASFLGLDDE